MDTESNVLVPPTDLPPPMEELPPLPFEDLERFPSFWTRVGEMFRLLFNDPLGAFERVPRREGLGGPWRFTLLLALPALLLGALIMSLLGFVAVLGALGRDLERGPWMAFLPIGLLAVLALIPLIMFVGMVVVGAMNHFFLWMFGGTHEGLPVEQTIRATGYAHAFIQLAGWVPYLGPLIQVAALVGVGMGLARMHRTDTWRGICAALMPVVVACACAVMALIAMLLLLVRKGV